MSQFFTSGGQRTEASAGIWNMIALNITYPEFFLKFNFEQFVFLVVNLRIHVYVCVKLLQSCLTLCDSYEL